MAPRENRLARETSPYLRQHRFDPVEWYPWGEEAFSQASELDRPLFLSIGYSACHWCHVMAHESFADPETAAEMNRSVVAVKVDREERPDVDSVYMEAVLAANGHGGWPMSVFATPDGRPFFAGTYFPDKPRPNMPSFRQVLAAVSDVWQNRRPEVEKQADALVAAVAGRLTPPPPLVGPEGAGGVLSRSAVRAALAGAVERLASLSDMQEGGFGEAPKFPQPLLLDLLLRAEVAGLSAPGGPSPREIVLAGLEAMDSGGIYDHLGGGFSRYSVDRSWVVPHFEKMLYDQALLARVHLHAWQLTRDERWRQVLDETLRYVLVDLAHPSGALCAAEDADSEGEEGRFYTWSADEFAAVVGDELAGPAARWYGVSEQGNFEGRNILVRSERGALLRPPEIERARALLAARRSERPRPGRDDKVLVEWNAMLCSVLAEAAAATGDEGYGAAARRIAAVLLAARAGNGGRTPRAVPAAGGKAVDGFAGDVAWLMEALVRLFELSGEASYLAGARQLAEELVDQFLDAETGTVFTTRKDAAPLVVRPAELHDNVIPAAGSVAAVGLARLGLLLGEASLSDLAALIVSGRREEIERAPTAVPELLLAADLLSGGSIEVVAAGRGSALLGGLRLRFLPTAVYAWGDGELPLLEGRDDDAVYLCRDGTCRLPARTGEELDQELAEVLSAYRSAAPR